MGQLTRLKEFFFPPNFKEISKANQKYLTHFSFSDPEDKEFVNIWNAGNIRFFINEALRRGNCFTLYYNLKLFNTEDLWDEAHFENLCQWVYFTFNEPLLENELQKIKQFDKNKLLHLKETISAHPQPYLNFEDNTEDAYFKTCLNKLNNLSDSEYFNKIVEIDKENRIKILQHINDRLDDILPQNLNGSEIEPLIKEHSKSTSSTEQGSGAKINIGQINLTKINLSQQTNINNVNQNYTTPAKEESYQEESSYKDNTPSAKSHGPFSMLLIGDPERTKKILIKELRKQGILFDFFKKRCGIDPDTGYNRVGFNDTCPAFIQFLTENDFLKNDKSWQDNLKLYFKETENYIDKKKLSDGYFRYRKPFLDIKDTISQINVKELKNKIYIH